MIVLPVLFYPLVCKPAGTGAILLAERVRGKGTALDRKQGCT